MYEAEHLLDAYEAWQRDHLDCVTTLMRELGVPLASSKPWKPAHEEGRWYRKGERDRIHFEKGRILEADRTRGKPRVVGERETDFLVVDEYPNPTDASLSVIIRPELGAVRTLSKVHSKTASWDIRMSLDVTLGKDEANNIHIGFESGYGESTTNERAEGTEGTRSLGAEVPYTVPPREKMTITQEVQTGTVEYDYVDKLLLDVRFWVIDWKELKRDSPLHDNSDWKGYKDTKSRYVFHADGIHDLELTLLGLNRRYPNCAGRNLLANPKIQEAYDKLVDEDSRTIIVRSVASYKEGINRSLTPYFTPLEMGL